MPNDVPEDDAYPAFDPAISSNESKNDFWIQSIKSILTAAVVAVSVIFGLFGGFLSQIAPPPDAQNFPEGAAQLLTLIVVLFVYSAASNADHCSVTVLKHLNRKRMRWSIAFAVMTCLFLISYYVARETLLFEWAETGYNTKTYIAGLTRITMPNPSLGIKNDNKQSANLPNSAETNEREADRKSSNKELMDENSGVVEDCWTMRSITQSRLLLLILYMASVLTAAACILELTDTIRIGKLLAKNPSGGS